MIEIKFIKPFYTKLVNTSLRIVFAHKYISIIKDGEEYQFIPTEDNEIDINIDTMQIENKSSMFVFQKDTRYFRVPLYQLSLISDLDKNLKSIIEKELYQEDIGLLNKKEDKKLIAKVNFKGFGETRKRYKSYYFYTDLDDLKKGDVVIVDNTGGDSNANFLEYVNEDSISIIPTKNIIRKRKVYPSKDTTEYIMSNSDSKETIKVNSQTEKLINEIMNFHRDNYIDKLLDDKNKEAFIKYHKNYK